MNDRTLRAVLFDLDGTLVDTLPDIATSMNTALGTLGLRTLSAVRIGAFVGKGPRALALRVLDQQPSLTLTQRADLVDKLLATYVRSYESRVGQASRLFPGVNQTLRDLSVRGLKLGVVTNALQHLAEAILTRFDIAQFMQLVIGGDQVSNGKPHPEAVLRACRMLGAAPAQTLMVGDSENDVLAARAAGCAVVAMPHGYRAGESVESLGCDIVADFAALPPWVSSSWPT